MSKVEGGGGCYGIWHSNKASFSLEALWKVDNLEKIKIFITWADKVSVQFSVTSKVGTLGLVDWMLFNAEHYSSKFSAIPDQTIFLINLGD